MTRQLRALLVMSSTIEIETSLMLAQADRCKHLFAEIRPRDLGARHRWIVASSKTALIDG